MFPRSNRVVETIRDLVWKAQYRSTALTRPSACSKYSITTNMSPESQPSSPSTSSPSASILLISPTNEILLLHRVRTSTSFASGHVFPGGHVSAQDGELPPVNDMRRHEDCEPYRLAAIRECFEESGILLAKSKDKPEELLTLTEEEREYGRHAIHENRSDFRTWVTRRGGVPDTENLIPFTRWLTPVNEPRRFSTQMYLYFLPIPAPSPLTPDSSTISQSSPLSQPRSNAIHNPTSDGGIEHTAAQFLPPSEWLSLYTSYQILLFAPQFFLLHLISPFLSPSPSSSLNPPPPNDADVQTLHRRREALIAFTRTSTPPWIEKCISGKNISGPGQPIILALHEPGPELARTQRQGDAERVLVAVNRKGNPLHWEVRWKSDVLMPADTDRDVGAKL